MSIHDHNFDPWNGQGPPQPYVYMVYLKHFHSKRFAKVMIQAYDRAQARIGTEQWLKLTAIDNVFGYFAIRNLEIPVMDIGKIIVVGDITHTTTYRSRRYAV